MPNQPSMRRPLTFGVREYWIVDPISDRVEAFLPNGDSLRRMATLSGTDVLTTRLLPGLEISLADLFRPL